MNSNKLYGLVNRVLLGFLAIDCLGNKCRLVSIPVAGYDITILQIIVALKLVAFNLQFMYIIWTLNNQRTAKITNNRQHINPLVESPELVGYRNRMHIEIQDLRIQTMVMMTWVAVAEYLVFKTAYTTPEYRNELVIIGVLLNSYQDEF
jgi:hypothetical protein